MRACVCVIGADVTGCAQSRRRCGSVEPRCRCSAVSPSPDADVAAASPVQLWAHADLAYPTTRTGTRVDSAVLLRVRRSTAPPWALVSALHRPAPLSAAKGSPHPRLPTARDRSQAHTRHLTNSAAHPGCRGLVKRQAAPYLQLRVGRPRHTRTQLDSLSGRTEAEPSLPPAGCMRAFAPHVPA